MDPENARHPGDQPGSPFFSGSSLGGNHKSWRTSPGLVCRRNALGSEEPPEIEGERLRSGVGAHATAATFLCFLPSKKVVWIGRLEV